MISHNDVGSVFTKRRVLFVMILIFCIALFTRFFVLGWLIDYGGEKELILGDTTRYLGLAESMKIGEGYVYEGHIESYRPPGYPVYLLVFQILGIPLIFASIFQIIIGALIPVWIFWLAVRNLGLPIWVGGLAGILSAVEPVQVFYNVVLMPDVFFTVFFLAAIYLLIGYIDTEKWEKIVFAGIMFGLANYFRPAGIYAVFVFAVALLLFVIWKKIFKTRIFLHLFIFIFSSVLVIFPWCVRNYYVFGSTSFVSSSAYTFFAYGGVASTAVGENRDYNEVKKEYLEALSLEAPDPTHPTSLRNKDYLISTTIEAIKKYPLAYVKGYILGVNTLFFSGNYHYLLARYELLERPQGLVSFSLVFASEGISGLFKAVSRLIFEPYVLLAVGGKIIWLGFVLLSLIGAILMRNKTLSVLFLASMLYFAVTILATTIGVEARHRYALNPLIFLFASVVFYLLYEKVIRRRASF